MSAEKVSFDFNSDGSDDLQKNSKENPNLGLIKFFAAQKLGDNKEDMHKNIQPDPYFPFVNVASIQQGWLEENKVKFGQKMTFQTKNGDPTNNIAEKYSCSSECTGNNSSCYLKDKDSNAVYGIGSSHKAEFYMCYNKEKYENKNYPNLIIRSIQLASVSNENVTGLKIQLRCN